MARKNRLHVIDSDRVIARTYNLGLLPQTFGLSHKLVWAGCPEHKGDERR